MSSTSSTQSNAANIAAILEQIKTACGLLQIFDAIISEWTVANEAYKARLTQTAGEMKKHINDMKNTVALLSNAAPESKPLASATPSLTLVTTKRALPSTSQAEPILRSKRVKSSANNMAATSKLTIRMTLIPQIFNFP